MFSVRAGLWGSGVPESWVPEAVRSWERAGRCWEQPGSPVMLRAFS